MHGPQRMKPTDFDDPMKFSSCVQLYLGKISQHIDWKLCSDIQDLQKMYPNSGDPMTFLLEPMMVLSIGNYWMDLL